jgi:hypothetical protein
MKYEQSYAHDLVGARIQGAARRTHEHIRAALDASIHWSHTLGKEVEPRLRFALVLGVLLSEAAELGVSEEEMRKVLKRDAESRQLFIPIGKREREMGWKIDRQDPSDQLTWEEYDAQVDKLREDDLRDALKREARLRRDALNELADVRGEGEIKPERNIDGRD